MPPIPHLFLNFACVKTHHHCQHQLEKRGLVLPGLTSEVAAETGSDELTDDSMNSTVEGGDAEAHEAHESLLKTALMGAHEDESAGEGLLVPAAQAESATEVGLLEAPPGADAEHPLALLSGALTVKM